ncbi:MAG: helix-turn-helix domain-containing protein [Hyphomicrobiales bacterium]|nr:helix-turn-helix domain-containing protein [Hyphomicrobiales bacterium]
MSAIDEDAPTYSPTDAAALLGLSRRSVDRLISRGTLPVIRHGSMAHPKHEGQRRAVRTRVDGPSLRAYRASLS